MSEENVCSLPECTLIGKSRCSGCHASYYCSKQHQTKHWKSHKAECKERQSSNRKEAESDKSVSKGTTLSELRSCRCMFCGEELEFASEAEAIDHMKVCPALQEQLNDDNQFTLPESMK
jgi:hypothetical protein